MEKKLQRNHKNAICANLTSVRGSRLVQVFEEVWSYIVWGDSTYLSALHMKSPSYLGFPLEMAHQLVQS